MARFSCLCAITVTSFISEYSTRCEFITEFYYINKKGTRNLLNHETKQFDVINKLGHHVFGWYFNSEIHLLEVSNTSQRDAVLTLVKRAGWNKAED
jgi:hypothetical protein